MNFDNIYNNVDEITKCAISLSVSSRRLMSKYLAPVHTPICDRLCHGRCYRQGSFFVNKPSLIFCPDVKCPFSVAAMRLDIKLNIIELLTTIMNTSIILENHSNSPNSFIYKCTTTHVNISGTTHSSNVAQIAISDFRLWRTRNTFLAGGCQGHRSIQLAKEKTVSNPSSSP